MQGKIVAMWVKYNGNCVLTMKNDIGKYFQFYNIMELKKKK